MSYLYRGIRSEPKCAVKCLAPPGSTPSCPHPGLGSSLNTRRNGVLSMGGTRKMLACISLFDMSTLLSQRQHNHASVVTFYLLVLGNAWSSRSFPKIGRLAEDPVEPSSLSPSLLESSLLEESSEEAEPVVLVFRFLRFVFSTRLARSATGDVFGIGDFDTTCSGCSSIRRAFSSNECARFPATASSCIILSCSSEYSSRPDPRASFAAI